MRFLLVEDDEDLVEVLVPFLQKQGYVVDLAPTLSIAKEALLTQTFDMVMLDRTLPDGDGIQLISFARERQRPQRFLLLSALNGIDDKVTGLDMGAADYLSKPFEPRELLARIRNALRQEIRASRDMKRIGPLAFDVHDQTFFIDDEPLVLRRTEALVLEALMSRPGALVQRDTLDARVYGYDKVVSANSIESQICRLRKSIAARTDRIGIQAIRGVGYRLSEA